MSSVTKKSLGEDVTCTANPPSTLKCSPITTKQKKRPLSGQSSTQEVNYAISNKDPGRINPKGSTPQKCDDSVEGDDYPETTQNLLLGDTYSEDELGMWMEEQQQFSQTQKLHDDSPAKLAESTSQQPSPSKPRSKRPADGLSVSDSHTATSSKRRKETSHLAAPNNGDKSEARKRMDKALQDRYRCQMALRDSLVALREAQALVRACRKKYNAAKCNAQTVAKNECETLLKEETHWNQFFQKLKAYKERTGHCNVKQNFAAKDSKNCPETAKLSAWVGRNRKDGKQRRRGGQSAEDELSDNISDDQLDNSSVFDEVEPDSIHADPYKLIALDQIGFDWDPRNSRWMSSYEELKAFKLLNGNTLVPHANCGLGSWVKRQQVQYTLYTKGDRSKSELTEERVRLLNDLGFVWSRRSNTWNENFQRLSKWKEDHGNCNIPDDSDDPELVALNKWIADQRMHYKRQICEDEENGTDDVTKSTKAAASIGNDNGGSKQKGKRKVPRLSAEKIAQLKSIGFEFDSRDAKWMQRLDELHKYKEEHGDFLVPSNYPDNPTLSNWVQSQRAQYKLYKKGGKTNLTERRLKILMDAGFSFSGVNDVRQKEKKEEASQQDRVVFDAKPWLEKYKDLLFFIANNDGIELLKHNDPCLAEWNAKEHDDCRVQGTLLAENSVEGGDEMKERTSLIEASDLFAFCQSNKKKIVFLRDSAEVESTYKEGLWDQQPDDTKVNTDDNNLC